MFTFILFLQQSRFGFKTCILFVVCCCLVCILFFGKDELVSVLIPLFLNTCKFEFKKTCAYDVYVLFTEAHDALHNFSCKMLASRKCDECEYKEGEQPLTTNKDS